MRVGGRAADPDVHRWLSLSRPLGRHGVTAGTVPSLTATVLADPVTHNTPHVRSDDELRHLLLDAM